MIIENFALQLHAEASILGFRFQGTGSAVNVNERQGIENEIRNVTE